MKTFTITIAFLAILVGVSCSDSETGPLTTAQQNAQNDAQRLLLAPIVIPNIQGSKEIYYRNNPRKIALVSNPQTNPVAIVQNGQKISKIFYTMGQPSYNMVLDLLTKKLTQNTMLHLIEFNGVAPYQFHSINEIEAAMEAGEITITNTEILYIFAPL